MTTDDTSTMTSESMAGESMGWRPNEGDVLSGKIVNITRGWSDWTNAYYPLLTIHDTARDSDIDLHCFHATLQERVMETRPKVGDEITVAYLGKRKSKDGKRTIAIYQVTVPGATGAEVWDSLERQRGAHARAGEQGTVPDTDEPPF